MMLTNIKARTSIGTHKLAFGKKKTQSLIERDTSDTCSVQKMVTGLLAKSSVRGKSQDLG